MKTLICGNGPIADDSNEQLEEFDHVVRINRWKEFVDPASRCDGWAFYPWHDLGQKDALYDFSDYLPVDTIWMPHYLFELECLLITGQKPTFCITKETAESFYDEIGYDKPTTGMIVLKMAILMGMEVFSAGFNFYNGAEKHGNHKPILEKKWYDRQKKIGSITAL